MKTASSFCALLTAFATPGALAQPAPAPAPVPVVESFFNSNALPPANGAYVSPAQFHAAYANGVIIRNPSHHIFTRSLPPPAGGTQIHSFGSTVEFEDSMDGGQTFNKVSAPAQVSVSVTFKDSTGGSNTLTTEMLQLDVSGGSLPPGVMLRESPTLASTGQTTVRPVPGGYMISSFFDIFTELSLDGGQTWSPAQQPAHVDLRIDPTIIATIPVGSTLLPPPDGQYVTPAQFHAAYAAGVVINDIRHRFFTQYQPPPLPGNTNIHTFGSQIDMQLSMDSGKTFHPARVPASVSVRVSNHGSTGPDGIYDTEMLALDLQGGDLPAGVMLRESPTLPSRGGMAIQTQADGTFRISSFFDIFTELSTDGGKSWQPATTAPAHVELERASAVLLFPSPNLPPSDGQYVSPQKWHALYANGIILSNVTHKRFTQSLPPATGQESFGSQVDMQISTDGGQTFNSYWAPAAVTVQLTATAAAGGNTQYFDTEMLALDVHGGTLPAGIMLRESPSKASLGRTSLIPDPVNGGYRISSFFDIFTELSLDGGQTWNAALSEVATVSLVNQPPFAPFVVHCPDNITVFNGSPSGAVVGYTLPPIKFYPDCPFGPFDATCVPPSGSYFPLGTTTVTCSGRDGCGETPSCTFQVTVLQSSIIAPPEWVFDQPLLPPPHGVYVSPGLSNIVYANGFIIRNVRNRMFTGGVMPPPFNQSMTMTFGSELSLEFSMDGGQSFESAHALADGSVRLTSSGGTEILRTFDTEMVQLDVSEGTLPPGVMLRESPTLQSIGKTTVRSFAGGGQQYQISSFFDVFTELSLDGGQTWSPADQPTAVELHSDPAAIPPISAPTVLLPPPDGEYVTPAQFHAAYAAAPGTPGIVISDIRQHFFTQSFPPPPPGGDQVDTFNSQVDMMLSTDGGQTFRPARAPAAMSVHVINLGSSGQEGLFETELVSLNLQGGDLPSGVMIRESPTLPSRGGLRIQKQADGTFQISSFFDVFTELSMDGKTWQPSTTGPAHVELHKRTTAHLFPTEGLPPPTGQFITPAESVIVYGSATVPAIIISNVVNRGFPSLVPPPPGPGITQTQQFTSQFDMLMSLNNGQSWTRVSAPATEVVRVSSLMDSGNTRYFDTEMLALSISGGTLPNGIMLRESPSKASLGRTTRTLDPATGQFHIDSFFDVFTELSLSGTAGPWNPAVTGPSIVGLTPAQLGVYTINCPGDMTVNATSSSGAAVDFLVLIPLFPDCPFGPYTYSCTPPAGSVFPIGTTTVNCVGSDGCGEHPTCSFKVTVRQPFTYNGLVNSALGKAVLAPVIGSAGGPASGLIISNLSQSGADGFRIDAVGADGVLVNFQPFPVDVQTCAVSKAFSPFDELLSVATFFGGSNAIVKADFSELGSVQSLVQVMDENHQLIYSTRIDNNAAVSINQFWPNPCPNGKSFYTIYQDYINVWVRFCRAGCDCSGTNCFTERIICISGIPFDASIFENLGYLEIRSQGVNNPSSLVVLNEQLMEFGNLHLAKGQATISVEVDPASGSRRLPVNNLGSSGQDGVSIDLTRGGVNPGGGSQFDMSLDPVTLHNPGVCWKMTAFGQFNGIANTELGMASLTDGVGPGGGCEVRVDFSAIGSPLARVDIYQGPEFVGSTTIPAGVLGTLFEQGNLIACGKLPTPFPCFYARFDGPFVFLGTAGPAGASQFAGTEIRILAANPAGQVQNITSFCVQACNLPSFTITGEQIPQPIEVDTFDYSLAQITLSLPSGATETVVLSGPATVEVAIGAGGEAGDSDGNGLDDATTQMTTLDLKGMSSMGPVHVTLDPNRPSMGRIEETSNLVPGVLEVPPFAPGTADSFFDVFFEIQIGGPNGPIYFPAKAARMQAVIHHKPPAPEDNYVNPFTQPIDLLDANGTPTGIRILREVHTPNPPKEIDQMTYGLAQLTLSKPGGATEVVTLAGPTTVEVTIPPDGLAADPDSNGHDQAPSRMTSLDLQGNSSMGPVRVMLDPTHPTLGLIEERVNGTPGLLDIPPFCATGTADSFFDVFPLIEVGGQTFHIATPLHMQAVITHKPPGPGDTYTNVFTQPVDLLDANGNPTGIKVIREVHIPNPPVEIDQMTYGNAQLTMAKPDGQTEVITLAGPATVQVAIPPSGLAADTDGDGLDQVPSQMTFLDLHGNSSMGPVQVILDPAHATIGEIEETVNNTPGVLDVPPFTATGTANSFFDVFAEIHVGGLVLHPATAIHMQSVIHHKPPGPDDTYVNPFTQPIDLLDANGNPTGIKVIQEVHTPNPPKEIDQFPNTQADITVQYPNGALEVVHLSGPTTVSVAIPPSGLAADTDGDGRDQVPTEMTQFDLTGTSSAGPVAAHLNPGRPTLGEIEEQVNNTPGVLDVPPFTPTGAADSFFDVFLEFQVAGLTLHNDAPFHMTSVIHHKPPAPGDTYVNPFNQPIDLLDANGNPTGIKVLREVHTPVPTNCVVSITCPADLTAWTCSTDGTKVSYIVNASNVCGGTVTVSCKPASGGLFPVGLSTVTCTASDGFGSTASCSFKVTVIRDTTPPRLVCPNDIIIPACNGRELVSYIVTATDDCDPAPTVVCNPPSGSAFLPGTTPVTCVATDSCGNNANCAFLVVVVPPKMSFTTSVTGNTRQFQICWTTPCPGTLIAPPYRVQCARGLGSAFQWENVTNAPVVNNGTNYCITVAFSSEGRFYRLVRYTPQEVYAPTNSLPPTGSFNSPSGEQTTFPNVPGLPNGIITRWFVHRVPPPNPPVPPPCLTCPDTNLTFSTTLDVQYSIDGGNTFSNASAPASTTVKVHPSGDVGSTRSFDTEMLNLDVAGGNLPLGTRLRESPTKQSLGKHTIRAIEGGYMISSFFDVFLEVSAGGGPFVPALSSVHVEYNAAVASYPYPADTFPPIGFFNSPSGVPTRYLNGLIARNFQYQIPKPPVPMPPPCLTCPPELFDFPAVMSFQVSTDGGVTYQQMTAQVSSTQVMARHSEDTADTRFFDTELLLFRVSPGPTLAGMMLRESPTLPSRGKTTVRTVPSPTGASTYQIGSFFDVFTEVSLDNGATWSSGVNPTHLELNPQPLPP